MSSPGMLYVTMQPKPGLPIQQFHEWYNNEHGPTRLRLPQIFGNGLRYQATDGKEPSYLAAYDVTSMSHLVTETYTSLRANRSPREAETIGQVEVKRYFWDLVSTYQSPLFIPVEQLTDDEGEGIVFVAVELKPTEADGAEAEIKKWYDEEHAAMLSKVPGWLRTRLFRTSTLESGVPTSIIALHEYAKDNGMGGPEHKACLTPRRDEVFGKYATLASWREYSLFYIFGPAPRDLLNLSQLPSASSTFKAADAKTVTSNTPAPTITSYVTTPDGLSIPYRLEGNPDPKAPTIAFCNSLLTSLHMWDPLVDILKQKRPKYRILRYDTRGRHSVPSPPKPATLDMLADDLSHVLEALRIPKLGILIGVSIGGATTLEFALKYPSKLEKFIACDFNAASSPANTSAWKDRIVVAETPLDDGAPGIKKLAGQTVERWFHPATMQKKQDTVQWMTDMVAGNDVEGFKYSCQALWDYDMKAQLKDCEVPGLLVVGEGDGKGALVKAMDGFRGAVGEEGVNLVVVPEAGHLPMCEEPEGFWNAVDNFL
ncbi:Uu.00g076290.m01.CDS01 [Anthostomella pinea]|uniref:Uu.00g076290.m01.CDS01 n=1 Tax=Anthostomella pinea TaxID=933095 RepID=A0AAI8YP39_9PEZI|nr:Uu.00g076290.m01.CDS01 [Anthostomella pinea]